MNLFLDRLPSELSGGQKQRICIARALAANPDLIICDEVTSALDQIVQEGILKLLQKLQKDLGVTYIFITHDIATVKAISDEIVVMYQGEVVEQGLKSKIFISENVSESRAKDIASFGAEIIRVRGNYDDSLKACIKQSGENNWKIVQDVSTKNYSYVPLLTMAGYSIMIKEISKQTSHYITHIFLQAGVGGMAAGVVAGVAKYFKRIPKIIIVEPDVADCVLQSIKSKSLKKIKIKKRV